MSRPQLSIILTTCDRPENLKNMLEDFQNQTLAPENFEVIISDDGSGIPAQEVLKAFNPPFSLHFVHGERLGPATARNRALPHAQAPVLLFLNDDLRLEPDLLEEHLYVRTLYPEATAILGTFDFPDILRQDRLHRIAEDLGLIGTTHISTGIPLDPDCFCTGNLSVPTEDVQAIGGFDENFREAAGEDVDLGFRLAKERGILLIHSKKPVAWHHHHHQPQDWLTRCARYGRTWQTLAAKHRHPIFWPSRRAYLDATESQAAYARVLAQESMVKELRSWFFRLSEQDDVQEDVYIECLARTFSLPEETDALLQAALSGLWGFIFQRSFWEQENASKKA